MTKVVLYIAATLDGFIAGDDGNVDFLSPYENTSEDYGYRSFYASVDALAMGSRTYDFILKHGKWPYGDKRTYVFTGKNYSKHDNISLISEVSGNLLRLIQADGKKRLWLVGGGALIRSFIQYGFIDEYIISVVPRILGKGIPLFPEGYPDTEITFERSVNYKSGLIQLYYKRK